MYKNIKLALHMFAVLSLISGLVRVIPLTGELRALTMIEYTLFAILFEAAALNVKE